VVFYIIRRMKTRKKAAKKSSKKIRKIKAFLKEEEEEEEETIDLVFRERRFSEINLQPEHPAPIPGYKSTLPGPPGWQAKERPGA
jgi:hypothetical protein